MPTSLDTAAEALRLAHARVLGALVGAEADVKQQQASAAGLATKEHKRREAIARNHGAQAVIEHSLQARDHAHDACTTTEGILAVADHITVGVLTVGGAPFGVNEEIALPFVLPLIGRANVTIDAGAEAAGALVQKIVAEALQNTAPAQLDLIGFDPSLSGVLSPFAALRSAAEGSWQVASRLEDLDRIVHDLSADVQQVNDTLRGLSKTLLDFRSAANYPVGRLQLVVLLDRPDGGDERLRERLLSLARVGPPAGIAFVFVTDSRTPAGAEFLAQADPAALGSVIVEREGRLVWQAHPQFTARLPHTDSAALAQEVDALVARIASASAPSVPFGSVQSVDPAARWTASSAERLRFAIGRSGPSAVEVTLGDRLEQRHNLLITGAVGRGKSNLLKVIVHSLAERYSPDELELYLLDFKEGISLYPFAPTPGAPDYLPHARVLGLESDREFGLAVLRHLEAEFSRRAKLFRPYGDDIARYRAAVPDASMPRIVLMIDEFHLLFDPADRVADEAAQLLEALARRGRSYGVHIILASQTVSGISALMTRENGIFAQFPIRLALKNILAESYASLSQGNDGAARLRLTGEAVLNLDYGMADANQQLVVAAADESELVRLRREWWDRGHARSAPPLVFDGGALVRVTAATAAIKKLRGRRLSGQTEPAAIVGYPITVSGQPLAITFGAEPGRNLALLGAGEKTGGLDEAGEGEAQNNAIGVLQTAAVSLALQHPAGDAEFVMLDLLDEATARRNNQSVWIDLMERLGFALRRVRKDEVAAYLREAADDLPARSDDSPKLYVLGFAVDRAGNLDTPDMFANRPVDDLQTVLRDGPGRSVHVLGWWANAATFKAHIGFGGDGYVETLLMLRLDQGAVQEFLGPFVSWSVRDNRGLVADKTQLAEPTTIIPFSPITPRDATALLATDWEG